MEKVVPGIIFGETFIGTKPDTAIVPSWIPWIMSFTIPSLLSNWRKRIFPPLNLIRVRPELAPA